VDARQRKADRGYIAGPCGAPPEIDVFTNFHTFIKAANFLENGTSQ
jgi:hypothetical protein